MSIEKDIEAIKKYVKLHRVDENVIRECMYLTDRAFNVEKNIPLGKDIGQLAKEYIFENIKDLTGGMTFKQLEEQVQDAHDDSVGQIWCYYEILRIEAPFLLDSYMLYIEKNRLRKKRFYEPRRRTLKQISDKLQALEDDELDELFIHMPARTGKSQLITMYSTWHCSRDTEQSNLYVTYKEGLGGAFIDGFTEIITDPTYCYKDVFPKVLITETDAKNNKVDLGTDKKRQKKYKSISGKGLESGLNGEYDAYGVMICDDLLSGIDDVLSEDRLKRLKVIFDNNVMSRPQERCKKIWNGTIWATNDIFMDRMNFLETSPEAADIRWDVIKIPALDPDTDETNFDYDYGVGFSTKYWRMRRAKFEANNDLAGWFAQCQQEPIDRTNALFKPEDMNYYDYLPQGVEPLKVIAHCDCAFGGADYLAFPVAYYYENPDGSLTGYIEDVVYDNSEKHITQPQVLEKIKLHHIKHAHFESNQGGESYKDDIERLLKEDKQYKEICNFSSDWALTTKRKDQRIFDNAQSIRELYFKDPEHRHKQYRAFMNNLFSFTMGKGKKRSDDAPDSLSGLVEFERNGSGITQAIIMSSPI